MKNLRPIVVCVLFLLLLLYVGSYVAMVTPKRWVSYPLYGPKYRYRFGGEWSMRIYWPLEQADRMLLPRRWKIERDYFGP